MISWGARLCSWENQYQKLCLKHQKIILSHLLPIHYGSAGAPCSLSSFGGPRLRKQPPSWRWPTTTGRGELWMNLSFRCSNECTNPEVTHFLRAHEPVLVAWAQCTKRRPENVVLPCVWKARPEVLGKEHWHLRHPLYVAVSATPDWPVLSTFWAFCVFSGHGNGHIAMCCVSIFSTRLKVSQG